MDPGVLLLALLAGKILKKAYLERELMLARTVYLLKS